MRIVAADTETEKQRGRSGRLDLHLSVNDYMEIFSRWHPFRFHLCYMRLNCYWDCFCDGRGVGGGLCYSSLDRGRGEGAKVW